MIINGRRLMISGVHGGTVFTFEEGPVSDVMFVEWSDDQSAWVIKEMPNGRIEVPLEVPALRNEMRWVV